MRTGIFARALSVAMAVCLGTCVAPVFGDPPDQCCTPGGLYGDGSDGNLQVGPGAPFPLEPGKNYRNVTIELGATLDTQGNTLRVCGTLENRGVITDTVSGGLGGAGGAGGLGGDPVADGPPGCPPGDPNCTDGQHGQPGQPPPSHPEAGDGGAGGGGGGGGGGAVWWNPDPNDPNDVDADGGDGAAAGAGGKGGGYVLIYALHLDNQGVIHADGEPGGNGQDAPGDPNDPNDCGAQYREFSHDAIHWDLAGGGGGAGAGGDGANGGTVEIHYAYLVNLNPQDIHANRGNAGNGGSAGLGGTQRGLQDPLCPCLCYGAPDGGGHGLGCPGGLSPQGGHGGEGAHEKDVCAADGTDGTDGSPGAVGTVIISDQINDCNANGVPDECDVAPFYSIEELPDNADPNYAAYEITRAYGVNDFGHAVGTAENQYKLAVIWRDDGWEPLPHTPYWNDEAVAYAINEHDQVVGYDTYFVCPNPPYCGEGSTPCLWEEVGGVWQETCPFPVGPVNIESAAYDINNLAQVVGCYDDGDGPQAFLWLREPGCGCEAGIHWLPNTLGGDESCAQGINDSCQVVGWAETDTGTHHAVYWTVSSLIDVEDLDPNTGNSIAYDINNSSEVVGESDGRACKWVWNPNTASWEKTDLGDCTAHAVDPGGQVVVGDCDGGPSLLWEDGLQHELDLLIPPDPAWWLCGARGINQAGQIVGWGYPNGETRARAFLLTRTGSADCNNNGIPDECELGDCNRNGVPDECDVAEGTSVDCDGNGVPDECELGCHDCNGNGILDECDIRDCDGSEWCQDVLPDGPNGIPDGCDKDDCNLNGPDDCCDIDCGEPGGLCWDKPHCGESMDFNGNGVPDECECIGDICPWDGSATPCGDGVIDLQDLAELLSHYGDTCVWYCDGDLNCDGDVDIADLAELLGNYGCSVP